MKIKIFLPDTITNKHEKMKTYSTNKKGSIKEKIQFKIRIKGIKTIKTKIVDLK
jgi:hypothetical protein